METRSSLNAAVPQSMSSLNGAQPRAEMAWTRLTIPEKQGWHSKETAKLCSGLQKRIAELQASRESLEQARAKLQEIPLEDLSPNQLFQADIPQHELFSILQTEVKIRIDLDAFYLLQNQDRSKARSQASADLEAAQADITEKLLAMGYLPPNHHVPTPGAILPIFILGHPSVLAARAQLGDLSQDWTQLARLNTAEMEATKKRMAQLKQKAIGC